MKKEYLVNPISFKIYLINLCFIEFFQDLFLFKKDFHSQMESMQE